MTDEIVIGGDMEDIPEGTYPAICTAINTRQSEAFGDFRGWDFTLESGSIVGGATSMSTNAMSKGGKWIAALLGRKPTKGESVSVIGKSCLVVVVEGKNGWPKVDAVLPPMAGTPVKAPTVLTPIYEGMEKDLPELP